MRLNVFLVGVIVPHVFLGAGMRSALVSHDFVCKQPQSRASYSHTDGVVEVYERFRRFVRSAFWSSMYGQ